MVLSIINMNIYSIQVLAQFQACNVLVNMLTGLAIEIFCCQRLVGRRLSRVCMPVFWQAQLQNPTFTRFIDPDLIKTEAVKNGAALGHT